MNLQDLTKNKVYTDNKGNCRMIIVFYDGFDGERRVQYEKGHFDANGEWIRVGKAMNCTKKSFSRWSKAIIEESAVA